MHKLNQLDQLSNDIKDLEEQTREKKMMLEQLMKMDSPYILAITLHACLCRDNHTDGCGWHYTKDTDYAAWLTDTARKNYLAMAKRVLKVTDVETATNVIQSLGLR